MGSFQGDTIIEGNAPPAFPAEVDSRRGRTGFKSFLAVAVLALLLVAVGGGLWQETKSRTFQFFGGLTDRVDTQEIIVALTFDDAPSRQVDQVLRILEAKHAKATFYEIGRAIEQYPEEARSIARAGMEVGNHSYSHEQFLFKSQSFIDDQVQRTNRLIRETGYTGEITFRPPNGKKFVGLPWYLYQHGIKTIMWDVEPDTYVAGGTNQAKADLLVKYTSEHVRPGSIILLHPFCSLECEADRAAIPRIIDGLAAQGYRFVSVSELLPVAKR